jgi:hypothetical protein
MGLNKNNIRIALHMCLLAIMASVEELRQMYAKQELQLELELCKVRLAQIDLNTPAPAQENIESKHPDDVLNSYIAKYLEFGTDTPKDKYRVRANELFDHLKANTKHPMLYQDFKTFMLASYNVVYKVANWHHKTYQTWFGVRFKEQEDQTTAQLDALIVEFVNTECVLADEYVEDTKLLYDTFEKYCEDKGILVTKQNGFTRQLFRVRFISLYNSIAYKEWASPLHPGKAHAFTGIKLRASTQLNEAVAVFVDEKCTKDAKARVKSTDLWAAFEKFAQERWDKSYPKNTFFDIFREQNPLLVKKRVTKCDVGYVGISLQ